MFNGKKQWLEFDAEQFEPMRILEVKHRLADHPLLQLPALIALSERIPPKYIRFHSGDVHQSTSFEKAPDEHKVDLPPTEVIRRIEESGAWLSLHHIQQDPEYAELVRDILNSVRPIVERRDSNMHSFAGWIFVSAPDAVTPYHMDHENNFILQLRGAKEIHVFDPLARSVVTQEALELFHRAWSRRLVTYAPEHEEHARVFHVQPGDGAYMPTTAPHWVKNGDNVSVTVSFTYYSTEARKRERLYKLNYLIRALGFRPTDVGVSRIGDKLKSELARALFFVESRVRDTRRPYYGEFTQWAK